MADRRRRRRHSTNSGSEFSGDDEQKKAPNPEITAPKLKEPGVELEVKDKEKQEDLSEYESANDEDDEYTDTSTDDSEDDSDSDDDDDDETYDEEGEDVIIEGDSWMEEERQSGDGEEQPDKQALDDDEDRKNPAYIPRKGAFYEHDTRLGEETKEGEEEGEQRPKKKLWVEDGKWQHDRYDPNQQAPKSQEELVSVYGYNILNYDTPPDPPKRRPRGSDDHRRDRRLGDFMEKTGPRQYRSERYDSSRNEGYPDHPPPRRGGGGRGRGRGGGRGRGPPGMGYEDGDRHRRTYTDFKNSRNGSDERDEYESRQNRNEDERNMPYNRDGQNVDPNREQDRNFHRGLRGDPEQYNQERGHRYREDRNRYNNREDAPRRSNAEMPLPKENRRGPPPANDRDRDRDYPKPNYRQSQDARQDVRQQRPVAPERDMSQQLQSAETSSTGSGGGVSTAIISRTITNENIPLVTTPATRTTNTVSERKSYSHDRRANTGRGPEPDDRSDHMNYEAQRRSQRDAESASRVQRRVDNRSDRAAPVPVSQDARESHPPLQQQPPRPSAGKTNFPPPPVLSGKQDLGQSRPKRYSSQRQRNMPDSVMESVAPPPGPVVPGVVPQGPGVNVRPPPPAQFYRQVYPPRGPPPPRGAAPVVPPATRVGAPGPSRRATTQPPQAIFQPESPPQPGTAFPQPQVIQPGLAFGIPPGVPPLSAAPPPRAIYSQPLPHSSMPVATMASGQPNMIPGPYVAAPVVSFSPAAPPPSHFQMAGHVPIPFQPTAAPPPPAQSTLQAEPLRETGIQVRGGTTYFTPQFQQPNPGRSPVRRVKVAIPIVNPQQMEEQNHQTVVVEGTYIQEHYDYEYAEGDAYPDTGAYLYTTGGQTATILVQGKNPDQIPEFIPKQYLQQQAQAQAQAQQIKPIQEYPLQTNVEHVEEQPVKPTEPGRDSGDNYEAQSQPQTQQNLGTDSQLNYDPEREISVEHVEPLKETETREIPLTHSETIDSTAAIVQKAQKDTAQFETDSQSKCEPQSEGHPDQTEPLDEQSEQEVQQSAEQKHDCKDSKQERIRETSPCDNLETSAHIDAATESELQEATEITGQDVCVTEGQADCQNEELDASDSYIPEAIESDKQVSHSDIPNEHYEDEEQNIPEEVENKVDCDREEQATCETLTDCQNKEQETHVTEECTQGLQPTSEDTSDTSNSVAGPVTDSEVNISDKTTNETTNEEPAENSRLNCDSEATDSSKTAEEAHSIQTVNLAKVIHIVDTKPKHVDCNLPSDTEHSDPLSESSAANSEVD